MKMGEVVEDANISQQHLQVASSVVVDDDEDEDKDDLGRALKEHTKTLSLVFTPQGSSSLISSGEPGIVRRTLSTLGQLPKHVDRKRRILNKKNLLILKQTTSKGNLQAQLKAKKSYELKFLEAVFVRNVVSRSVPRLPAPVSSSVEKVSNPVSTAPSDKSKCGTSSSDNKTNQKLDPKGARTFFNNDAHSVIPEPSAISDFRPYCGPWFNCLKGRAMNDREPNHLLQVAYDNFVAKDAKALWLSNQPIKSRSPSTHEKGPVATLPVDNTKSSEPLSHPVNSISVNSTNVVVESKTDSVTLNPKSDSGEKKTEASLPVRMPSRSPDHDKVAKVTAVRPNSPATAKSLMQTLGSTISTALSGANQKPGLEKGEKGRKSTGQCSTSFRKAVDTPKAGSAVSSNSSALSVKSVISENTDSSSSTSTSVSSSSLNENVSIGRTPVSSPGPVQLRGATNNGSSSNSSSYANTLPTPGNHGCPRGTKRLATGPKPPKKYSEKMKAEASVLQRISELQKEGMWWERRLPKVCEPPRAKVHWDYLLEEMTWMASDFINERKWKRAAAKKCSRMIEKYFHEKELKRVKAEKDEEIRKRRTAGTIAKVVRQFWSNVQTVVEFKEQSIIDSMRKKALDQKLSYLVNETEKFSEIVAKTFTAINKKTGIDNSSTIQEEQEDVDEDEVQKHQQEGGDTIEKVKSAGVEEKSKSSTLLDDDMDVEFLPPSDSESDVDDTIAEEEAKERVEHSDHRNELDELEAENNMSYDQLVAKYAKYLHNPDAYKVPAPEPKEKPQEGRMTRRKAMSGRQLRPTRRRDRVKAVDTDIETDIGDTSSTEEESHDEDSASETERTNDDLASLLKSISDTAQKNSTEEETNKLADLAESFKPKGYTLSSTTVVTKVPYLLQHTLREYQHIGLEWLVTMYDKRLNGILADEMGLGKTIQTIALLAYLAVERRNWGPHLIIVPTSVMLNWEMEFKKWCPGFKILTYYGSQKERKLKRSGWTKPNAFHVCITSYKLVIQDHQSFRRKRWKYLILDEAQNIKNFKSQRWQLLLNFNTQRRLLLTGTPLQNNLMELWSLLHFLMPNVFQSHMEFKDWFSNPMSGMVEGSQEYNEDIVRRLHKVLRPFILRRMKSEVEKQLPQKYEHVVMCSLSKRQRFLYEEFMSRTKTRDTLNQGNLLSVINVLMQLRKVCNHPNLFEPRPIVSPFQTEGINCNLPPCSWDVLRSLYEDSFRQGFPLFTISNPKYSYSEYLANRIGELTPLFAYNPDEERRYVVMNYEQCRNTTQPPAKRIRRIVNLVNNEPPPCPRIHFPITFFVTSGKPDKVLEDRDFVDYLRTDAKNKYSSSIKVKDSSGNNANTKSDPNGKSNKPIIIDLTDSDKESSASENEVEVLLVKKRKVAKSRFDVATRLHRMGISVPEFELDFIQERKLHDRKLVVNNLNIVNWTRCRVHTFVNQNLVEKCKIVGALPPLRLTSRRTKIKYRRSTLSLAPPRDYTKNGYFNLGYDDIMTMIKLRQECPATIHHPLFMWSITSHLDSLILTPESRLNGLMSVLTRYVMYIPAVSAPSLETRLYRPSSSRHYFGHLRQLDEYRKHFFQSTEIIHPIVSRMLTQFPDPRLIQYDCGKLQTLDTLLRRLKTGNHRVLIFTQMAKVLDILEAFLNYHGHTYLRLDGATKIDQRQLLMERFNADTKIFCFILSTRSGGIGVNLTGADTVIFYDSDWNPTMDAQAQDRCHRIGQTRDVHIYRLVSEKTVEENILKKSNQKRLLGELAIEGGKFTTTYFKQHTIRDLFTINEKDDVAKRLNAWDNDQKSPGGMPRNNEDEDDSSCNPVELQRSPEKDRNRMHTIECALAAAEDDTDVQAAQTVHAEAQAEMAEFDENLSLDALDAGKSGPNKFELEFQQVYDQLTDVERYAMRMMEATIDDWSRETVAQAQKDLEEQKLAWELQQQKTAVEPQTIEIDDDSYNTEDLLTYSSVDPVSQVWMAQYGNFEQEMLFPIYEPPTPPHDEMDVYLDPTIGYLYNYDIMTEDQLPPIYVPKHPKKPTTPVSPVTKPDVNKTPEPAKDIAAPEVIELDSDSSPSPTKKSPKVGRREDPIFAPKSLFDRPAPAVAKMRRDLRVQRYCNRPATSSPKTLGPGSITFPIVSPNTQKTPAPPTPPDSPEWLHVEDNSMLQCVRNTLELPLNLLLVNLAQTPNWDFAQDIVNTCNFYPRNWKQCKWRFENVVAPREEGKLPPLNDSASSSDPGSPSSGKKKKAKTFIKITPPSPSKAARNVKLSQLMIQDNNQQLKSIFCSKFDEIKTVANKKAPTSIRTANVNAQSKSNKHSQLVNDLGINYEKPLSATQIAQSRYERIQLERKKMQQQLAMVTAPPSPGPSSPVAGVSAAIVSAGPTVVATALSPATANPNGNQAKSRGTFTQVTLPGTIAPLVIQSNNSEIINRDVNIPNILAQQRNRQAELAQQQQQVLLQRQALAAQAQSLTSLLNQPQVSSQQPIPPHSQQNVTVRTTTPKSYTPAEVQALLGPAPPPIIMPGTSYITGRTPINVSVSSSAVNTPTTTMSSATPIVSVARPLQPAASTQTQVHRGVPTITMQDLVSSAANTQRFQTSNISTSPAPSVQTLPPQSQQPQPTLVSLTPMMGSSGQQLTTKIIQNPQGIATLVQSPARTGPPAVAQQTASKLNPLQLQYMKQTALMRPASPASTTTQQQQVQQIKDQLMNTTQIKRIQVVTCVASPPSPIVSSSGGITQQPAIVSLPSATIPTVTTFSPIPIVTATHAPVVSLSSPGTTTKVSLAQPHVTIMQCQSSPNVIPPTHVIQHQPQPQRQLQLVKQHTVGGKTVTRPVSEAEVQAFLKQHGVNIKYPSQTTIPGTKTTPVATYQGPVPVPGGPTLLTVGLQDLVSSAANTQRFQTSNISTSPAPSVQTGPPQSQQSQPTLVSLTPMMGSGGQQLATKIIQNPQGLVTLVQSSPNRTGSPTITQQTGNKISPLQLQYLKQGLMRPANPMTATVQQQQQVQQIKDHLMANTQQIKRIQVVTCVASPPSPIVSSSGGITQQPAIVSLPSATIPTVTTFSPIPIVTATHAPVVSLSSPGTTTKVSLAQPHVTIMQCQNAPNVIPPPPHVIQHQQAPRQLQVVSAPPPNAAILAPGPLTVRQAPIPSVSIASSPVNHTIQLKLPPTLAPPEENN